MKAQEILALAKIGSKLKSAARKEILPGVYAVDFRVRVQGEVKVGDDYETTPTQNLSPLLLAALAIKGRGATKETFKKKLAQLMKAAVKYQNDKGNTENKELEAWVAEALKEVHKELAKLDKRTNKGAVRTDISFTHVVEAAPLLELLPKPVVDKTTEAENILDEVLGDEPSRVDGLLATIAMRSKLDDHDPDH